MGKWEGEKKGKANDIGVARKRKRENSLKRWVQVKVRYLLTNHLSFLTMRGWHHAAQFKLEIGTMHLGHIFPRKRHCQEKEEEEEKRKRGKK